MQKLGGHFGLIFPKMAFSLRGMFFENIKAEKEQNQKPFFCQNVVFENGTTNSLFQSYSKKKVKQGVKK